MSNITDISFPDIFESLNTGRDSSDRVLQTIIEGLLAGRYKPGERVVARQLAEELGVSGKIALTTGFHHRPERETARDLMTWWDTLPEDRRAKPKTGPGAEKEAEVIAAWKAHIA